MDSGLRVWFWFCVVVLFAVPFLVAPEERGIAWVVAPATLFLLSWIYYCTYYELRQDYLYCRCGPFVRHIPYERIQSARLVSSFISSWSLSIKRIEIREYGRPFLLGTTFISPKDREKFLCAIRKRCPQLESTTCKGQ